MGQSNGFPSLSSQLLARKGNARPAMRANMVPLDQLRSGAAEDEDDLGWNDMGDDVSQAHPPVADIVPIRPDAEAAVSEAGSPAIADQRRELSARIALGTNIVTQKRRAAFTLRLDAERHLRLRLASTILGTSAQEIVTEALDRQLATMPDLAELAGNIRNRD